MNLWCFNSIMKMKTLSLGLAAIFAGAMLFTGCDTINRSTHRNSSLYAYLYPDKSEHVDSPSIPVLRLPLRVGIAFVPPANSNRRYEYFGGNDLVFPEVEKMALMKQISSEFKKYPFVNSIELVPSLYLTPGGGFENLDQIRAMYGVDVMALVSYDQVQFTDPTIFEVTYWTIVGGLVVPGEKNDTRTMLDTAVYDIASRKLLFRAPGLSMVKCHATPLYLNEDLREDREAGLRIAATNLVDNLQMELAEFKQTVTNSPAEYKIEYKPGYTGAGAIGGVEAAVVAVLGGCFLWTRRARKA